MAFFSSTIAASGAIVTAAIISTMPFATVDDTDVRAFHGAKRIAGFYGAEPGALYEVLAPETGVTAGGSPLCRYTLPEGTVGPIAVAEGEYAGYRNRLGSWLPLDRLYDGVHGPGNGPRSLLTMRTTVRRLAYELDPAPEQACEEMAAKAVARGSLVCVVEGLILQGEKPWAIRFKPWTHTTEGAAPSVCPLAVQGWLWRIKEPLIVAL